MEIEIMEAFTSIKSDQEIGMPDVEHELARLKARRNVPSVSPFRKIAATIAIVVAISGIAVAAVVNHQAITNFFTGNRTSVEAEAQPQLAPSDTIPAKPKVVKFANSELEEIMTSIGCNYGKSVIFKKEELKHVHLHFQYDTSEKLERVILCLNMFEKIKIRLNGDKLEVE